MSNCIHNGIHTLDCPEGENARLRAELESVKAKLEKAKEALLFVGGTNGITMGAIEDSWIKKSQLVNAYESKAREALAEMERMTNYE